MIVIVPLLVWILGLVLYYRVTPPADPRTSTVGINMFWVGLLVFLLELGPFVAYVSTIGRH